MFAIGIIRVLIENGVCSLKLSIFSERNISLSCSVSRNTVSKVIKAADEKGIAWTLDEFQTDKVLEDTLFPKEASTDTTTDRPMPDL